MRKSSFKFAAIILATLAARAFAVGDPLTVTVLDQNNNPVPGAWVYALSFTNGNPDPTNTQFSQAGAGGIATFSASNTTPNPLTDGAQYTIVAASQSFLPNISQQFSQNPPNLVSTPSNAAVTIHLSGPNGGLSEIDAPFTNASAHPLIFGQVGLVSGGPAVTYGLATVAGGAGTIKFYNVKQAAGNTYVIGLQDTGVNPVAFTSQQVASALGGSVLAVPGMSFLGAPPPVVAVNSSQLGGQNGTLSYSGVVVDATNGAPVPFASVNVAAQYKDQFNNSFNDFRNAQTDQNGAFQFYGLQGTLSAPVTYYMSMTGTCNNQSGQCYQGFQSGGNPSGQLWSAPPVAPDFLFSGSTLTTTIQMKRAAPGSGALHICVTDQNGNTIPQAGISVNPDNANWAPKAGSSNNPGGLQSTCQTTPNNPGLASLNVQAPTGCATLNNLPSGNYNIQAWTPFGQGNLNFPGCNPQSQGCWFNCQGGGGGQSPWTGASYRVTIDTTASSTNDLFVFDSSGNALAGQQAIASTNVVVNVSTVTSGLITGTISFSTSATGTVDLSAAPIVITANGQGFGTGGYVAFNSATQPQSATYQIHVASGVRYNFQIQSTYWGAVFAGGSQPFADLTSTNTAVVNLQFGQSGIVTGTLRKPDGSAYVTLNSNGGGFIDVEAEGENAWGWAQVGADGSFQIGGLLPGSYHLAVQSGISSSFPYTTKSPAPVVTVTANQTSHQDLNLVPAVTVAPTANGATNGDVANLLPPIIRQTCMAQQNVDNCPGEDYTVLALPAGTPMNTSTLIPFLSGDGKGVTAGVEFYYDGVSSGTHVNSKCNGTYMAKFGICPKALAATQTGTAYDFYLLRKSEFDQNNNAAGARPALTIISSSKTITVGTSLATTHLFDPGFGFCGGGSCGSTSTVESVDITPPDLHAAPQGELKGTVTINATSLITAQQFAALGGDFNGFLNYLPIAWIYDSSGALKAAGMVTPNPVLFTVNPNLNIQLNQAVSGNNYTAFQNLMGPNGWGSVGYDIRGLTPGQAYTFVMTTPNLPPFKTTVTLNTLATSSTTVLNVDLTLNTGATLAGVVKSTAGVLLGGAGVSVSVSAPGYGPTTITPSTNTIDASGDNWSLPGLLAGTYQVTAQAAGYASVAQNVAVTGNGVVVDTTPFTMPVANSSIKGIVGSFNPIGGSQGSIFSFGFHPLGGLTVVAFDDTVSANNPSAVLPLYSAVTGNDGTFTIPNLVTGDAFNVYVEAPGYFLASVTTTTVSGSVSVSSITLSPKPLDVNVFGFLSGSNYELRITNFQSFANGSAWIGPVGFSTGPASAVNFSQKTDASGNPELVYDYPLADPAACYFTASGCSLIISAQPNDPSQAPVLKTTVFGQNIPNNTCQAIDQALLGDSQTNAAGIPNNQVPIDVTGGNASGLSLPVGGVIPTVSTNVPSMCMTQSSVQSGSLGVQSVSANAFASGIYNVALSSINYNRGINLTLSYNQNSSLLSDLAIYVFDPLTSQWKSVPGTQTIDPVRGTISINGLSNLTNLSTQSLQPQGALGPSGMAPAGRFTALFDGHQHHINPRAAGGTDTAKFAVMKPSLTGAGSFTGTEVKIYNFPNPFNLTTKSVPTTTVANGNVCSAPPATVATNGTVIKAEVPSGISGQAAVRIYTLSGRLVRELDAGTLSGTGQCIYLPWDGLNRTGDQVADGVYYGIFTVGGDKSGGSHGIFKMAVVK